MSHPQSLVRAALALTGAALVATGLHAAVESHPLRKPTATPGAPRLHALTAEETGVKTPNVFNDPRMWGARFRELTLGAVETGIAIADFDGDGLRDIFAVSKNGPCSLYRQTSTWKFEDVATQAGVTGVPTDQQLPSNTGASVVDINGDGRPDIYLCRYELPNLLFVNQGDGTFKEEASAYGLNVKDASVHAVWADYDRDGFVDMYLVTNILDFSKSPQGRRDFLFHNQTNGTFKDVTKEAGVWGLTQGHTALWADLNQDGWPDIYVANDFETPDRYYLNRGNGTFTDVIDERLPHVTYFSMGADAGDINNDGLVDLFITDMRDRNHREYMAGMEEISRGLWEMERVSKLIPQYMWNAVYLNSGNDRFLEAAHLTGLEATGWTWSARLVDLDNDGRLDAFVTAGMVRNFIDADLVDKQRLAPDLNARAAVWKDSPERRETPLVYRNEGSLKFSDVSDDWGMHTPSVAFGCAVADLDDDGDLDLVYSNYGEPPTLVRNESLECNRLIVQLRAAGGHNAGALGAEVTLRTAGGTQIRQVYTERGITASEPADLHFGLGSVANVDSIEIRWPNGERETIRDLAANQRVVVAQGTTAATPAPARFHQTVEGALVTVNEGTGLNYTHVLKPFDELTKQRLLPRRLFATSPALATADVNGDGLADIFVSGTSGQAGKLFLGTAKGGYEAAASQPWEAATAASDAAALFFDANGDGKVDLLIAAGGVEHPASSPLYHDRLYLNDGNGNFSLDPEQLTGDGESTQTLVVGDAEGKGSVYLFAGARSIPGQYPKIPRSFLYKREGGKWNDVTDTFAPALRRIGLVTAAAWSDLDGDGKAELAVATEWGPVRLFSLQGSQLAEVTRAKGLSGVTGWWSALAIRDVNGDNHPDLVVGNAGLNTKYHASAAEPTLLFAGDFDGNGRFNLVEAKYEDGKNVPVRGRSKLAYAFPWLTKKTPTYRAFGETSLEDLFGADKLARAERLAANELQSGVFLQQTDGTFLFRAFPREAQLAPIQALALSDLNGDGQVDIVAVGNNFFPEPTTGRFDGAQGWIMLGKGDGSFAPQWPSVSGFSVPYDSRSVLIVENSSINQKRIVVSEIERAVKIFDVK